MEREQAPPMTTAQIERMSRDPDRHYRYVGLDKDAKDSGRVEHHKDLGYKEEGRSNKMMLMSIDKKEHEARQEANRQKAERNVRAAAKMAGDKDVRPTQETLTQTERITD